MRKWLVQKAIEKATPYVKKGIKKFKKSDAPFAAAVAGVEVGRHIVNKLVGAKDIHEGTITGIVKEIKKGIKKKKKDKE